MENTAQVQRIAIITPQETQVAISYQIPSCSKRKVLKKKAPQETQVAIPPQSSFAISFTSPEDDLDTFSKNLSHKVFQNYLRKSLNGLSLTAKKWLGPTQLSPFQSPFYSTLNAFSIEDPGRGEIKGIPKV